MADRLNEKLTEGPYAYATSLFHYIGDYAGISKSLKFHRNFESGKYFARLLADSIRQSEHLSDIDMVTCVPLHWTRRISRGYNQAEIIARVVAESIGVSYAGLLLRSKRTNRQARIGGENEVQSRADNVKDAFRTTHNIERKIKGKRHILVIDDVFTSGATLSECVKTLKKGANEQLRVSVAAIAYAGV